MAGISSSWILRHTVATVLALLAGVALMAIAGLLVATQVPGGVRDLRAYEAAPRCAAAPAGPAECRWTQEFTASGIRMAQTKSKPRRVFLTDADGVRWETSYSSKGPVLETLDEGDRVIGTVWRGKLTEIAAGGESQETYSAPADMRARVLIGALIMGPTGLLMAVACAWRLLRCAATPGMVATLGLAFGVFCGGLLSPLPLGDKGEDFWMVAAVWLTIAAILTAAAAVYATRKRAPATAAG